MGTSRGRDGCRVIAVKVAKSLHAGCCAEVEFDEGVGAFLPFEEYSVWVLPSMMLPTL